MKRISTEEKINAMYDGIMSRLGKSNDVDENSNDHVVKHDVEEDDDMIVVDGEATKQEVINANRESIDDYYDRMEAEYMESMGRESTISDNGMVVDDNDSIEVEYIESTSDSSMIEVHLEGDNKMSKRVSKAGRVLGSGSIVVGRAVGSSSVVVGREASNAVHKTVAYTKGTVVPTAKNIANERVIPTVKIGVAKANRWTRDSAVPVAKDNAKKVGRGIFGTLKAFGNGVRDGYNDAKKNG